MEKYVSYLFRKSYRPTSQQTDMRDHKEVTLTNNVKVEQSFRSHLVKKNKNLSTALQEARTYLAKVNR